MQEYRTNTFKTAEELKKGLECSVTGRCAGDSCPYYKLNTDFNPLDLDKEEHKKNYSCLATSRFDAYRYILYLEAVLAAKEDDLK